MQDGECIHAPRLSQLAFGERRVDVHGYREAAIATITSKAAITLEAGGQAWNAEACPSDVSTAVIRDLPERR